MSWRDATVADLLRGRVGVPAGAPPAEARAAWPSRRPTRRPTGPRGPLGERALEGTRSVAVLAAVSAIVLALAVPVLTLLPGLAAGSRILAADRAGHPVRPLRDALAFVRRTTRTTWPISAAVTLGLCAACANLLFLGQQPTGLAAALVGANLAAVALGGCWIAACARELADAPTLTRPALLRAATARALRPSRWHLALTFAALLAIGIVLVSPLLAAFFAPALGLLAGRLADPAGAPTPTAAPREVTS